MGKQKSSSTTPLDLSVHESQTNTPRSDYKALICVKRNQSHQDSNDILKSMMDRYNCGVPKLTVDDAQRGIVYTPPGRTEKAIATISINLDNRARLIDRKQMSINEEIRRDNTNKSLFVNPERCEAKDLPDKRLLEVVLPFIKYERSWFGFKGPPSDKINDNSRAGDSRLNRLSLNSIRDRTKAAKVIQRRWKEIINSYDIFIKKLISIQKHAKGYLIRKGLSPILSISLGIRLTSTYIKNTFLISYFRTFFSDLVTIKHLYERRQQVVKQNFMKIIIDITNYWERKKLRSAFSNIKLMSHLLKNLYIIQTGLIAIKQIRNIISKLEDKTLNKYLYKWKRFNFY
jgi:hypothetical protein